MDVQLGWEGMWSTAHYKTTSICRPTRRLSPDYVLRLRSGGGRDEVYIQA